MKTNIRIIAATNRDLIHAVQNGEFRTDLFYRFQLMLTLPPLRARPEDIPLLADFFLQNICHEWKREAFTFSAQALEQLQRQSWQGNVRELRSTIEQCVMFKTGDGIIGPDELPVRAMSPSRSHENSTATTPHGPYHTVVRDFRRQVIYRVLERAHDNATVAAGLLGLQRTYLGRLIKQLGIRSRRSH